MDENGRRFSTFDTFIPRKASRPNLFVCPGVIVPKVDFQPSKDGLKAVGVVFQHDPARSGGQSTPSYHVLAKREIVHCSGAVGDPQLLMLR